MTFRLDDLYIGAPPIEQVVPAPAGTALPSFSPGEMTMAEDPAWGPGEFIFARAGGAIPLAALCILQPVWDTNNLTVQQNMIVAPNTANLGQSLYVYVGNTALTTGQYGWFMMSGTYPISCTASVAANTTLGIAAAGQGGANSAGKQILNARVAIAATQTVVSASVGSALSQAGALTIQVKNTQGFFPGAFISGTGVGASAVCSFVDPIRNVIGVTVANSANVTGNVTATYNNGVIFYNVVQMNRMFAQGAIT
jgi:hypothetical protein